MVPEHPEAFKLFHERLNTRHAEASQREVIAWASEMAGSVEIARLMNIFLDSAEARKRNIVIMSRQGKTEEALSELDANPPPEYLQLAIEVLTYGNATHRAEAVDMGRKARIETMDSRTLAAWLDACIAAGEFQEGLDAIDRLYADKPLDLTVKRRREKLAEGVGRR